MRKWLNLIEAMWDTENWWEPKLDPKRPGQHGAGDWHPDGFYQRFGVPEEVENRYSNGQCPWLALAMNERFGWPIRAEMMDDEPDHIAHAYCLLPDGREIDILGPVDKVDQFDGGKVRDFSRTAMLNWLKKNSQHAGDPATFEDHMNDARKAVDLFIAPKVKSQIDEAMTPQQSKSQIVDRMVKAILDDEYWDGKSHPDYSEDGPPYDGAIYDMSSTWHGDGILPQDDPDTPEFEEHLRKWADARYDHAVEKLKRIEANGRFHIFRVMKVEPDWLLDPTFTKVPLGRFWCFDLDAWGSGAGAYAVWGDKKMAGHEVLIEGYVDSSAINWPETILANMDWFNGDTESEIRLLTNSPIHVVSITRRRSGQEYDLTGRSFIA